MSESFNIFVGFLSSGGPTHSGSFILGQQSLISDDGRVRLQNPIWIQRTISGMNNGQPIFIHQVVVDPLFQCTRDGEMTFNKEAFTGFRTLNRSIPKDSDMILFYEKNLTAMHAAIAGIALPPDSGKVSPLKSV